MCKKLFDLKYATGIITLGKEAEQTVLNRLCLRIVVNWEWNRNHTVSLKKTPFLGYWIWEPRSLKVLDTELAEIRVSRGFYSILSLVS